MNWDRIEGSWKQLKGEARKQWGKLTDSDWEQIGGSKDKLVGKLQERYGWSHDQAMQECEKWGEQCLRTMPHEEEPPEEERKVS